MSYFGDIVSQSLGLVMNKLNLRQQKQVTLEQMALIKTEKYRKLDLNQR